MGHDSSEQKSIFLDEVASSKLNLHGGCFWKYDMVTLVCLRHTRVSFMG